MEKKKKKTKAKTLPEKTSKPQEGTREKLLHTALRLFADQGYDRTSTKQICDEAGANVAAIAYHFETKENLLREIFLENLQRDATEFQMVLKPAHNLEEFKLRIRLFCEFLLSTYNKNPKFHRLLRREAGTNAVAFAILREGIQSIREIMQKFFSDAKKKGFVGPHVDENLIGHIFFAMLMGVRGDGSLAKADPSFDLTNPRTAERYLDRLLLILFHGIIPPGGNP